MTNWDEALHSIENQAVVNFFRTELAAARSNNPTYKALRFFVGDRRRFIVSAKKRFARVYQSGRFEQDVEFWRSRLGESADVTSVESGRKLRFYLYDENDFSEFTKAVGIELLNKEFQGTTDEEADES